MSGWATLEGEERPSAVREVETLAAKSLPPAEEETAEAREARCRAAYSRALKKQASSSIGSSERRECTRMYEDLVLECDSGRRQQESRRLSPIRCLCLKNLSAMSEEEGDSMKGLAYAASAAEIDSCDAGLWLRIYRLAKDAGRLHIAHHALERVLTIEPHHCFAMHALTSLMKCLGDLTLSSLLQRRSLELGLSAVRSSPATLTPRKRAQPEGRGCALPDMICLDLRIPSWTELGRSLSRLVAGTCFSFSAPVFIRLLESSSRRADVMRAAELMSDDGSSDEEEGGGVEQDTAAAASAIPVRETSPAPPKPQQPRPLTHARSLRRRKPPGDSSTGSGSLGSSPIISGSSLTAKILSLMKTRAAADEEPPEEFRWTWAAAVPEGAAVLSVATAHGSQCGGAATSADDEATALAERCLSPWKKKHERDCKSCKDGGELLCCDFCPSVYHKECVAFSDLGRIFACPLCIAEAQQAYCVESMADGKMPLLRGLLSRWSAGSRGGALLLAREFLEQIAEAIHRGEVFPFDADEDFRRGLLQLSATVNPLMLSPFEWTGGASVACTLMLSEVRLDSPATPGSPEVDSVLNGLVAAATSYLPRPLHLRIWRLMGIRQSAVDGDASAAASCFQRCLDIWGDEESFGTMDERELLLLAHLGPSPYAPLTYREISSLAERCRAASAAADLRNVYLGALSKLRTISEDIDLGRLSSGLRGADGGAAHLKQLLERAEARSSLAALTTRQDDLEAARAGACSSCAIMLWSAALSGQWGHLASSAVELGLLLTSTSFPNISSKVKEQASEIQLLGILTNLVTLGVSHGGNPNLFGGRSLGFLGALVRLSAESASIKILQQALTFCRALLIWPCREGPKPMQVRKSIVRVCCVAITTAVAAWRAGGLPRGACKQRRLYTAVCSEALIFMLEKADLEDVEREIFPTNFKLGSLLSSLTALLELSEPGDTTTGNGLGGQCDSDLSLWCVYPPSSVSLSSALALLSIIVRVRRLTVNETVLALGIIHSSLSQQEVCADGGRRFLLGCLHYLESTGSQGGDNELRKKEEAQCLKCLYGITVMGGCEDHPTVAGGSTLQMGADAAADIFRRWRETSDKRLFESIFGVPDFRDPPTTPVGSIIENFLLGGSDENGFSKDNLACVLEPPARGRTIALPLPLEKFRHVFENLYYSMALQSCSQVNLGKQRRSQDPVELEKTLQQSALQFYYDLRFSPGRLGSWKGLARSCVFLLGLCLDVFPVASTGAICAGAWRNPIPADRLHSLLSRSVIDVDARARAGAIVAFMSLTRKCFWIWSLLAEEQGCEEEMVAACEEEAFFSYMIARDLYPLPQSFWVGEKEDLGGECWGDSAAAFRVTQLQRCRILFLKSLSLRHKSEPPKLVWHVPFMLGKLELKLRGSSSKALGYFSKAVTLAESPDDVSITLHRLHTTRAKLVMVAGQSGSPPPSDDLLSLLESFSYGGHRGPPPGGGGGWESRRLSVLEDVLAALEECSRGSKAKWSHRPILSRARVLRAVKGVDPARAVLGSLFEKKMPQIVRMWRAEGPAVHWHALNQTGRKFHLARGSCVRAWVELLVESSDRESLIQLLLSARQCREDGDFAPSTARSAAHALLELGSSSLRERSPAADARILLENASKVYLATVDTLQSKAEELMMDAYAIYCEDVRNTGAPPPEVPNFNCSNVSLDAARQCCELLWPGGVGGVMGRSSWISKGRWKKKEKDHPIAV